MEKMRRIFPGLFALLLALLIVLLFALPAQADNANHTFHGKLYLYTAVLDPVTGTITSYSICDADNTDKTYVCTSITTSNFYYGGCYYNSSILVSMTAVLDGEEETYTFGVVSKHLEHDWDTEWTVDEDTGTHYHKCLRKGCDGRSDEDDHTFGKWTPDEKNNNHKRVCSVCFAEETGGHTVSSWTAVEGTAVKDGSLRIRLDAEVLKNLTDKTFVVMVLSK